MSALTSHCARPLPSCSRFAFRWTRPMQTYARRLTGSHTDAKTSSRVTRVGRRYARPWKASAAARASSCPPPHTKDQPAVSRMTCPDWWRRQLRKHQGRIIEAAAIRLGYVNKNRDLYVSEERFKARMQQNRRNEAALEATTARNELGQLWLHIGYMKLDPTRTAAQANR